MIRKGENYIQNITETIVEGGEENVRTRQNMERLRIMPVQKILNLISLIKNI